MENEWVDFRAVKEAVTMKMVLDHYGVKGLREAGDQLRGPCPIHKAKETARSFTVHLDKNAFNCFSCGSKGNVLDFVAAMENCSVKDAALMLKRTFRVGEKVTAAEPPRTAGMIVKRGIYRNGRGDTFEVVIPSAVAEDLEEMVVYRELFGDYRFWVASVDAFFQTAEFGSPQFTLVKEL
jgi:hypothetical protein